MLDKTFLMIVQDKVFADPQYWPEGDETFCNLATLAVCQLVGCHAFDPTQGRKPLLADEMYSLMKTSKAFLQKPMRDAIMLSSEGVFMLAALPSSLLHQNEGHICTLTIGDPVYSGHWNAEAPVAMNLGKKDTCFRSEGVNYAFVPTPEFFAWVPTL